MNRMPDLHGCTPSDLENMGMDFLLHLALTAPKLNAESGTTNPEPVSPLTLTPLRDLSASVLTQRNPGLSGVKSRKPRSKASNLPPDILLSLNTMLAAGRSYAEIIQYLIDQGYPGFNKVNLHNWRITGYQHWLRAKKPEVTT